MLKLVHDYRLNNNRLYLTEENGLDMQAVPDEVRKCVAFIYFVNKTEETVLAGTGFFVNMPIEGTNKVAIYLVTAKHVIAGVKTKSKDQNVYIRLNTTDGASKGVRSHATQWLDHPEDSTVDVSILAWAPDVKDFDYLNLPTSMAVTEDAIAEYGIGAGDEVFLTGLFSNHFGETKNLPIIRTGSIALMSPEKVRTKLGLIDAYLIEARSIGGLSGSPVFAYLGHVRASKDGINLGGGGPLFTWLGVMHGHWKVDEDAIDAVTDEPRSVNMGIGIVVPATKVLEILETQGDFVKQRKEAKEEFDKAKLPVEDSLADVDITKDDFEKTLKKVSSKTDPENPV